jgi:hypothetical protein
MRALVIIPVSGGWERVTAGEPFSAESELNVREVFGAVHPEL